MSTSSEEDFKSYDPKTVLKLLQSSSPLIFKESDDQIPASASEGTNSGVGTPKQASKKLTLTPDYVQEDDDDESPRPKQKAKPKSFFCLNAPLKIVE